MPCAINNAHRAECTE